MKNLVAAAVLPISILGVATDIGVQSMTLFGLAVGLVKLATSMTDLKDRVIRIEKMLDQERKQQ